MAVKFAKLTKAGYLILEEILDRADVLFMDKGVPFDRASMSMDILAVHHSCPLKLEELAKADKFQFAHDIAGIYNNINRETGELENCFLPRFAKEQ